MSTRREYVAAWRAENGNVVPFGSGSSRNVILKYVEEAVARLNAEEMDLTATAPYFVAFRDLPSWEALP